MQNWNWDVWKVYCWERGCGGVRWLRFFLRFSKVRWRLASTGCQDAVYFSIRNPYQRYASVAESLGGHIQTLRVFLRRLSLGRYFGIRWAFWGRAKGAPTVWRPLARPRGQTWIARWKISQKVIVKFSTSAFIVYRSPANSAKPCTEKIKDLNIWRKQKALDWQTWLMEVPCIGALDIS